MSDCEFSVKFYNDDTKVFTVTDTVTDGIKTHALSPTATVFSANGLYYRCIRDPTTGTATVERCPDECLQGVRHESKHGGGCSYADAYVHEEDGIEPCKDMTQTNRVIVMLDDGTKLNLPQGVGLFNGGISYDVDPNTGALTRADIEQNTPLCRSFADPPSNYQPQRESSD